MRKSIILIIFVLVGISTFGQEYNVPKNWKFETENDYRDYVPQIKEAIDWALNTPLNIEPEKRTQVNAFVLAWLTGTPDVSIAIDENAVIFFKTNPELLMPFTMGWTQFSLDNNSKDSYSGFKAGAKTAISFYRKNIQFLKKDKDIEKYEKLMKKGKLDEELNKILKF